MSSYISVYSQSMLEIHATVHRIFIVKTSKAISKTISCAPYKLCFYNCTGFLKTSISSCSTFTCSSNLAISI